MKELMFTKKLLLTASLSLLSAASLAQIAPAITATDNKHAFDIEVTATIPDNAFQLRKTGTWANAKTNDLELAWDEDKHQLKPATEKLAIRSTSGAVKAKLAAPAELTHKSKTTTKIPLTVTYNNETLDTATSKVVIDKDAADIDIYTAPGFDFTVAVTNPGEQKYSGDYSGTVSVLFETDAPI
jgi:hypothetical protein